MKFILICLLAFFAPLAVCAQQTQRVYVSGSDVDHPKSWDFFCSEGRNSGKWSKIDVPSCWELQGFGAYTYGRFYKTKGLEPSRETGRYRTKFSLPKSSNSVVYRLVFEGAMTDTRVWIDGQEVGPVHQGGFVQFAYDVTSFVRPGKKQTLEVLVSKESENKSVNSAERRADWWLFGGIYRPVYFEILPSDHIEHVSIDARANGDIYARVEATSDDPVSLSIDGRYVPFDSVRGCYSFPNAKPWDPEHPNLYTATFTLGNGKHVVSHKIGFRTIEFRPHDGIYLNGVRLVVKGTNRHCFHPETGRATSPAMSLKDAQLIRQMNMNAVRCHYPSDSHFLDVCDSIGLLYMDEFPGWQTRYDDATATRLLPDFVRRDVNHPCLFIWSNGNEGGWNTCVDSLFGRYDLQHRKVVHPWSDFDGIDTHHYPAYQTGPHRLQNGDNVFMPTEFLHGKYDKGQGAALEDMWSHWTRSPLFAGGFLWAYVDEAVRRRDLGNILDSDGGNGPDGCMDPYRQPEASFFTIREVWSPVYVDRLHVPASFDGRLLVENRYLFSNLNECSMSYRVLKSDISVVECGSVALPNLAPGERGFAHFDVSRHFWEGDVLEVVANDSHGDEVCKWTAPIHRAEQQNVPSGSSAWPDVVFDSEGRISLGALHGPMPVGMEAKCIRSAQRVEPDGSEVRTYWYAGGVDSIVWRISPDGRVDMDAVILNDERGHGGKVLTDESKWQIGFSFEYPEADVQSVRWMGRGPYRVWRNRLKGQQFGVWSLDYNNTVTGQYNQTTPPVYPEFKGYRSDLRWAEFQRADGDKWRVYCQTENIYWRLFTPQEAVDQTPGEMGGLQEGRTPKNERTMVAFPAGDISFLISIPPMQSYKPLEQLGPLSMPDNIRIKSGDEGFHIRLSFVR